LDREIEIIWTQYMLYRAEIRGFDIARIEEIVRYSNERYIDQATGRLVAIGKCGSDLVMVAYEMSESAMVPVTAHVVARSQIESRLKSGRFSHE
jgi:hypothetical protein